jgi:basic membrane protein A
MKKAISLLLAAAALALLLAACGSSSDSSSSSTSESTTEASESSESASSSSGSSSEGEGLTIGFLAPAPRNDGGLTQYSLLGAEEAAKEIPGAEVTSVVDNVTEPQEQVRDLRSLAEEDAVVIAASATLNQAVAQVAPSYPETRFILLAGTTPTFFENATALVPDPGLDAVVAGAVMATGSKSKTLGVVAGVPVPASAAWGKGVKQGAELVDPSTKVASTFTGDYNDVGKAKQAAQAQIAEGADQVLGDLDSGIEGVYQAAAGSGKEVATYQVFALVCEASPTVVGSGVISWTEIVKSALDEQSEGKLPPGAIFYGLQDPKLLSFQFCPGKGSAAQKKIAKEVTAELAGGELEPAPGVVEPEPEYQSERR